MAKKRKLLIDATQGATGYGKNTNSIRSCIIMTHEFIDMVKELKEKCKDYEKALRKIIRNAYSANIDHETAQNVLSKHKIKRKKHG